MERHLLPEPEDRRPRRAAFGPLPRVTASHCDRRYSFAKHLHSPGVPSDHPRTKGAKGETAITPDSSFTPDSRAAETEVFTISRSLLRMAASDTMKPNPAILAALPRIQAHSPKPIYGAL